VEDVNGAIVKEIKEKATDHGMTYENLRSMATCEFVTNRNTVVADACEVVVDHIVQNFNQQGLFNI
jgi:hypothetical protein